MRKSAAVMLAEQTSEFVSGDEHSTRRSEELVPWNASVGSEAEVPPALICTRAPHKLDASRMWGSGIAGILCAIAAIAGVGPAVDLWRLGFVASFCSKLSDTTASEVGKAYGRTTYMSTPPFKPVPRGTEGAVSLEGTVAGIGASLFYAGVAAAMGQVDGTGALIATFAAFAATTAESWLGATTQGEEGFEWLTNDVVNAVQITLAAVLAVGLGAAAGLG